jgi:hypothetical protein
MVALHYHHLGLTLSHYDARGHLVVARRIFDSLTPGWQQIGAVWLPLPHLLNALPVQLDAFYRNGASAVAISITGFAMATMAIAWIVWSISASPWASAVGAIVFALNPNVLYLQSTPMTEPLLIGLTTLAVAALIARERSILPVRSFAPGILFALACLTRYEAWPVTMSAIGLALLARAGAGEPWRAAILQLAPLSAYPAGAILAFAIFSRVVIGEWFVAGGFFVPENTALHHPFEALSQVGWGVRELSGPLLVAIAAVGFLAVVVTAFRDRTSRAVVVLSLPTLAALPWLAFVEGHPYRIRYMVPLMAAEAVGAGVVAGLLKPAAPIAAAAVLAVALFELHPLDRTAPMIVEAQWDLPNVAARRAVGACLRAKYRGESIMASMGSLGHYMQELSHDGFAVRDFLHEGNGDIWLAALDHPRPYAGWVLIEEQAEGGDVLARRARESPSFLHGFTRVCEGAGVALYRRD